MRLIYRFTDAERGDCTVQFDADDAPRIGELVTVAGAAQYEIGELWVQHTGRVLDVHWVARSNTKPQVTVVLAEESER